MVLRTLNHHQGVEIDDGGGDRQQRGVETVEHASVAWKDMATILDAEGALEE